MNGLQDVLAGDSIVLREVTRYGTRLDIRSVARVTRTQVIDSKGDRWSRSKGFAIPYCRGMRAEVATDEDHAATRQQHRARSARAVLTTMSVHQLSDEQAIALADLARTLGVA